MPAKAPSVRTPPEMGVLFAGFSYGFVLAGMLVTSVGLLLQERIADSGSIATLAGLVLGARWLSEIALAPIAGSISDRMGRTRALPATAFMGAVCILLVVVVMPVALWALAIGVMFLLGTALQVNAEASAGDLSASSDQRHILGRYATAVDLGSAAGPLLTLPLVSAIGLTPTYVLGAALLLISGILALGRTGPRP
jgi:MFS family permease